MRERGARKHEKSESKFDTCNFNTLKFYTSVNFSGKH